MAIRSGKDRRGECEGAARPVRAQLACLDCDRHRAQHDHRLCPGRLAWRDQQKSAEQTARLDRQIFWTRIAAIAACIAGLSAAIGWGWTILFKP
jgi:hypothetical protein